MRANSESAHNILISPKDSWEAQSKAVLTEAGNVISGSKYAAIFCVAGGWAGGNGTSPELVQSCERMWQQSVQSSVIAGQLACKYLEEGGLLALTGAKAALSGTPGKCFFDLRKV